ncbi:Bardet-Biedl syndrome 9 isoform X3 [Choristoneura fumiferana]|uniref:Bardet-Biedl syndrome 9 isoform X3 n=1 Tax=Choristoneura fumiferana TaxID=7141 RepID=UPI003D155DAD
MIIRLRRFWPSLFLANSDSDCIVTGDGSILKLYKPVSHQDVSHTLLESDLNSSIIQIETGKFIAGQEDRQILVLHPQSYAVYKLYKKEGHTDVGDQNSLETVVKHSFTRRACSITCGPFGNKSRDCICVQSLDSTLSFFDQDTFLFMCIFNDVIIPGPVCYIASCDSFVICKSTWVLEIYSYQQLRELSELNIRQNKKSIPQWVYNTGEEVASLQAIRTSSNFSSIIALGERHLYCFQDNGLMKYMIKFDFVPICFNAFLIGWYYEPGARLLVMVVSEDSKLFVYENTSLLWCCDLPHFAISVSRCFLKSLPGGVVTLSNNGVVQVSYLGTEPDLNANAGSMINDTTDPEAVHAELAEVEETLQKILENKEEINDQPTIEKIINIKADAGKPVQNLFQEFAFESDAVLHLLMCPVVLILTCEDPKLIQSIQITYVCPAPFACSEQVISLDSINGTEIVETQVFVATNADISNTCVQILLTVTDSTGKIDVLSKKVLLPASLYCSPTEMVSDNNIALYLDGNKPCINVNEIFTDFSEEELAEHGTLSEAVTFAYRNTKKTVTVTGSGQRYTLEAKDFSDIIPLLDHLIIKLIDHYTRMAKSEFQYKYKFDSEISKQIIVKLLKSIEVHAKERIKLKNSEDELSVLQRQFTLVQKRLLVQYGSLPPRDCDMLEYLMKDTHSRLVACVTEIIQEKEAVCRAGNTVTAVGNLIVHILKNATPDTLKIKLIEEMLALNSLYEDYQELEETVTQAMSYIVNEVLKKSEKDREKLAPVTEQGVLSHINLKRFLKQIKITLERMFTEARNDDPEVEKGKNKVLRIEEFVEVL